MPRETPNANLAFCETHDLLRIVPINGSAALTLGTAELVHNGETYKGGIMTTSENKASITSAADKVNIGVQNVDKAIGITLNQLATSLVGSKAVFMRAFKVDSTITHELANKVNVTSNPTTGAIARVSGDNTWNAGASSVQGIRATGYIEAKITNNTGGASWISLTGIVDNSSFAPAAVNRDWTLYASIDRFIHIYYRGELVKYSDGIWNGGDIIKINLTNTGLIQFFHNGQLIHEQYWSMPQNLVKGMAGVYSNISGIQLLNFLHDNAYETKTLLVGEITDIRVDEDIADITVLSDIGTSQAYAANQTISEYCPLVFKSTECGYVGGLTTCSKRYSTSDGCAGRNNQHRFGGIIDKGELQEIIINGDGGFPETIGPHSGNWRYGNGYDTYILPNSAIY